MIAQSSFAQPAYTFRGAYSLNVPMPSTYFLVMEDSGARFQVETSIKFGNRLSILAGIGPPWASRMPLQRLHTYIQVML